MVVMRSDILKERRKDKSVRSVRNKFRKNIRPQIVIDEELKKYLLDVITHDFWQTKQIKSIYRGEEFREVYEQEVRESTATDRNAVHRNLRGKMGSSKAYELQSHQNAENLSIIEVMALVNTISTHPFQISSLENELMRVSPNSVVEKSVVKGVLSNEGGYLLSSIRVIPSFLVNLFLNSAHILFVDACFCSDGSRILLAVFRSFDGHIQPIGFSICQSESYISWNEFMNGLKQAGVECEDLVIMSDQSDSIKKAVKNIFPDAEHSFCTIHFVRNIQKQWQERYGALSELNGERVVIFNDIIAAYNRARKALTEGEYKTNIEKIRELELQVLGSEVASQGRKKKGREGIDESQGELQTEITDYIKAHHGLFAYEWKYRHYGCDTTNPVETAMALLAKRRGKNIPIREMDLFNRIRALIEWMFLTVEDRDYYLHNHCVRIPILGNEVPVLTQYAVSTVLKLVHQFMCYRWQFEVISKMENACENRTYLYSVLDKGLGYEYEVNLKKKSCSCHDFYHIGIPCIHFIGVLVERREIHRILEYVGGEYAVKNVDKTSFKLTSSHKAFLSQMNALTKDDIAREDKPVITVWWTKKNRKKNPKKRRIHSRGEDIPRRNYSPKRVKLEKYVN